MNLLNDPASMDVEFEFDMVAKRRYSDASEAATDAYVAAGGGRAGQAAYEAAFAAWYKANPRG